MLVIRLYLGQIISPSIRRTIPDDSTVFKILKDVFDRPNDEITTNSEMTKAYAMVSSHLMLAITK